MDWLLLSFVPFSGRVNRCHHLARELVASGDRVLWVDPPDPRGPSGPAAAEPVAPGTWRSPSPGLAGLSPLGLQAWAEGLRRVVGAWRARALVTLVQAPDMHLAATAVPSDLLVWDALDDWRHALGGGSVRVEVAQRSLARRADLTLAVSEPVAERVRALGARRVELLPNACRPEDWAQVETLSPPEDVAALSRPRLVYTGGIDEGLDLAALRATAEALPGASLLLVGPLLVPALRPALEALPGLRLLGERPYAELPRLLAGADACLLPFRLTPFNLARDSSKVYEYLAAGKPVVATATPQARRLAHVVDVTEDAAGFARASARVVQEPEPARGAERRLAARGHSWQDRAAELRGLVRTIGVGGSW